MVTFLVVVPLMQRGGVLLTAGWDVEEIDVAGCNVGGASGVMGVDTGDIGLEVFNCFDGKGGLVVDPTPVPNS